jgi:hypothetical protein
MAEEHFSNSVNYGESLIMPRVINPLPMPAGAAVPARPPQSQPTPIPQAEPAQPAAAQSR